MTTYEIPTVGDAFGLMAKTTELSLSEYTSITQSQADIELYLEQHLKTFSTVLYGAFSRKTIVSPLHGSVIDMLVLYRDQDIRHVYPSRIFSKLCESLIEEYPDAYAVEGKNILMFPVKNFIFKIHPAYPISDHSYMVSDQKFNEWVKYDINSYSEVFVRENVRHKGLLIEIIRMIKTWNRVSGSVFNGFYLELLVTEILSSYQITSYAETLRYIFGSALSEVVFQKHDPSNSDFLVEGLNDIDSLIAAMHLLKQSYTIANEAIIFEQDGDTEKALLNWNKLFPQALPTHVDMLVGKARNSGIKGADALRMMINTK